MITIRRGNLLEDDAEALVNTVNTVGVMGKGIALQFKRAYPDMFADYEKASKSGEIERGRVYVWETNSLHPKFIVNFATKGHWRGRSRLVDVETGLQDLVRVIREKDIASVALPALGAGNGGLEWDTVRARIIDAFSELPEVDVRVYEPAGAPKASDMRVRTPKPTFNVNRAALVALIDRYRRVSFTSSLIEVQKLAYFLQLAGQPLRLQFEQGRYGPYTDTLRHVLNDVEGHYLVGFGDGSASALDATSIEPMAGAAEAAEELLRGEPDVLDRIGRVLDVVSGFESMYGLELLATTYWVMADSDDALQDAASAIEHVHEWSPRKRELFSDRHIGIAWNALHERGWVAT